MGGPAPRLDRLTAAGLLAAAALVYGLLRQGAMAYDGVIFCHLARMGAWSELTTHPLLAPWLALVLGAGDVLGLEAAVAGRAQSALLMAAGVAVFFLTLRRAGVARPLAVLYAALAALNATLLDNATLVALYAAVWLLVNGSLYCFLGELARPRRGRAAALWLASTLLVLMHLGCAPWVLALYLALAWHEARQSSRALGRLLQGALVATALLGYLAVGGFRPLTEETFGPLFATFWKGGGPAAAGWNLLSTPLTTLGAYAGMLLFPAAAGLVLDLRRRPALAYLTLLAGGLFWAAYSFWPADRGKFFLPMQAVLGLYAALGMQGIVRDPRRWPGVAVLALAAEYGALVLWLPGQQERFGEAMLPWLVAGFYLMILAQGVLGWAVLRERGTRKASRRSWPVAGLTLLGLGSAFVCYLPPALMARRPDAFDLAARAVRRLAVQEGTDRLRLVTRYMPEQLAVVTGTTALNVGRLWDGPAAGVPYDRNPVAEWVRATGDPVRPVSLWFDAMTARLARLWWTRTPLADIPLDLLEWTPVDVEGMLFYRIGFRDGEQGRIHALYHDPYPAEDWTGTPMAWTRGFCELRLPPVQGDLRLRFWVGHYRIGPQSPVTVTAWIEDEPVLRGEYRERGLQEARLPAERWRGRPVVLRLAVTPVWATAQGQLHGVALAPLDAWDGIAETQSEIDF